MKKILIPILSLLLAACQSSTGDHTSATASATPTESLSPVSKATTDSSSLSTVVSEKPDGMSGATRINRVSFNGILVIPPQSFATVSLSMGGIIKHTSLLPGMYVKKGATLATLENPDFIALQQTYLDSHAQTEYLSLEYQRQQNLARQEAASQKKLQQVKADYESMKSRRQASAAQLALLGVKAEELPATGIRPYLEVKAPLNGYVGNLQMNLGRYVNAGEALCDIIDKSELLLKLTTYEKDLANIILGAPVDFQVNGLGDRTFHARLISVGQEVDEVSRSLEVYARVEQSDPLFRPGMYVTAQIRKPDKQE